MVSLQAGRWTAQRHLRVPPEVVWDLLTDPDAWPVWGPTVKRAEIDGGAVVEGARGTVWTPVGVPLPFQITDVDPEHCWSWSVAGVPATTHEVEPVLGGCVARMTAPIWAPAYLPVLEVALRRIERLAAERPTS
ncbi:SRPBCC family protein [Aeromicrobium massiliense]|uniref:SRPBCC family protein n=1 Tax=Aeromicrobium massiliense TaxID=1464554 RepID=UPI0003003A46|nr:SRPBCC family protein [Aeromicrobium massiliense]